MNKRLLAGGAMIIWREGKKTIIHHKNGLTLQLTAREARDLRTWLNEQAEFEDRQRMEKQR